MVNFDRRVKLHNFYADKVDNAYPGMLLYAKIRTNIDLEEMPSAHSDIFTYSPTSNGAKDYMDVANELERKIKREGNK